MELTEHLGELRQRILRSLMYLLVGTVIAYEMFTPLYTFLYRPLMEQMRNVNHVLVSMNDPLALKGIPTTVPNISDPPTKANLQQAWTAIIQEDKAIQWLRNHPQQPGVLGNVFHGFYEMFTVKLKLSMLFGLILTIPLIVREAVLFVLPALTPHEREPLRILVPLSICLLALGVTIAYLTMYYAMGWFLSYLTDFPQGATLMQDPNDYVLFFVKMMAAFGIAFQLPVVLMGAAHLDLVTSKGMIKNWRMGVILAVLGGVFTPSNDLISMALMAVPLLFLYFFSILLVRMVENNRNKSKDSSITPTS